MASGEFLGIRRKAAEKRQKQYRMQLLTNMRREARGQHFFVGRGVSHKQADMRFDSVLMGF